MITNIYTIRINKEEGGHYMCLYIYTNDKYGLSRLFTKDYSNELGVNKKWAFLGPNWLH